MSRSTLLPLEQDILAVFRAYGSGAELARALDAHDESGHVAAWIIDRMMQVDPWIARELGQE